MKCIKCQAEVLNKGYMKLCKCTTIMQGQPEPLHWQLAEMAEDVFNSNPFGGGMEDILKTRGNWKK